MSHQKKTFNQLLDYFNEDDDDEEEEEEEELINFEQKNINCNNLNPKMPYYLNNKTKNNPNSNNNISNQKNDIANNNLMNDKQKQIFTELYSNVENNDENILNCEQRYLSQNDKEGEFNKLKVVSFRQNILNENDLNENNENIEQKEKNNENDKIIEKIKTNDWLINSNNKNEKNDKQSQKEIIYNKIIANQCSFGNINETSNRSTSIYTDKIGISEYSQSKLLFQDNFDQELYKPEYLINSECFEELENNHKQNEENKNTNTNINSNKKENIIDTNIYTFKQKSNEKDWINKKELVKKEINQLKNCMIKNMYNKSKSTSKSKSKEKNIKKKNINGICKKKPIELVLYDDAIKKRQKMENLYKNNLSKLQLNSTKNKIDKTSYKIALDHDDKKIEQCINKYSQNQNQNEGVLTIVNIAQIFQDLKIFRKLLENININKLSNINNINEFKNIITIVIKEGDIRKNDELDFLEQTCHILNFEHQNFLRKDIFEGLLKILFASTGNAGNINVNDIVYILKQYLQAALFGEGIIEINNNNKKNDDLMLKNYIKKFFKLKENIIAYQTINNYNSKKLEKIIKERNDNLTFEPNIPQNENFRKTVTQRKKNFNFNSLYNRFIQKEKNKQTNLNQLRQNRIREELKELKKKPTINKHLDNSFYSDNNYSLNIHDKLYKMDEYIRQKKQAKIDEKKKEDQEKFENECKSFKLHLNLRENRRRMAKSFDNKIKPKGFDDYIMRNKKAILERERIKKIKEKIPCGENYEKIKRRAITPFNITDMKKKNKKNKNEKGDFFTLQIKYLMGN